LQAGRDLVVWLKHLENRSRHTTDRNDAVATYDFKWMWRDLNVDHLRNLIPHLAISHTFAVTVPITSSSNPPTAAIGNSARR